MKIFFLSLLIIISSCRSHYDIKTVVDPWHGNYLHTSGEFTLILNHFDTEAVAGDVFEKNQKDSRNSFFAEIKGNTAIFKDRTDPDCKLTLKAINGEIHLFDQCHGISEIDGVYKRTGNYKP